jgi:hypothetical protein
VTQLLITQTAPGVAMVTSTDPFSSLELYRIDREAWHAAPTEPGIYLLYGFVGNEPVVYVGMSTTSIRDRIRSHHVTPKKDWFGVLFAIPVSATTLIQAVEAELIRRVREAGVVNVVANVAAEARFLDSENVHIPPALDAIIEALQMLLGSDIFAPPDEDAAATVTNVERRAMPLSRVYKGAAEKIAPRGDSDPADATHRFAGRTVRAWGRFEAPEPDPRFRVFAGSNWRPAFGAPRAEARQFALIEEGILAEATRTVARDYVFENWTRGAQVISGIESYSGMYHWQRLEPREE